MNTHSCCNLSYGVYVNSYHEPALLSVINRCTHRALRNKDILKDSPNCPNKTVHQPFNSRKGIQWRERLGYPTICNFLKHRFFLLRKENKFRSFFNFSLFDTLSSTWGVLEEPVQHAGVGNSQPPKPLVKIPGAWQPGQSHAEETSSWLTGEQTPSTVTFHIPQHIQTPLRTSELGKQAIVLKGTLESRRGVEAVEHTGNNKDERWKDHCTVWGIRNAALEKVLMEWRFEHPTHTAIRYPSYWHKQNWEKQNIIWLFYLFYFKLSL